MTRISDEQWREWLVPYLTGRDVLYIGDAAPEWLPPTATVVDGDLLWQAGGADAHLTLRANAFDVAVVPAIADTADPHRVSAALVTALRPDGVLLTIVAPGAAPLAGAESWCAPHFRLERHYNASEKLDAEDAFCSERQRFVVGRRHENTRPEDAPFDAKSYWSQRLGQSPGIRQTGTSHAPLPWQRSLYRAKSRAVDALLRRAELKVDGFKILDVGCGSGFFEDLWERRGARRADGIDIVDSAITSLKRRGGDRSYVAGNLVRDRDRFAELQGYDLVTLIDVAYHIVDEEEFSEHIRVIRSKLVTGGWFLFTDALTDEHPASHVRFRSEWRWRRRLADSGFDWIASVPMYVFHNRVGAWSHRLPRTTGLLMELADRALLGPMSRHANMFAVLSRVSA